MPSKIEVFLTAQSLRPEMLDVDGVLLEHRLRAAALTAVVPETKIDFYLGGKITETWRFPDEGDPVCLFSRLPARKLPAGVIKKVFGEEIVPQGKLEWAVEDFAEEQADRDDWPYEEEDDLICRRPPEGGDAANVQLTLDNGSYEFWRVLPDGSATCFWANGSYLEPQLAPTDSLAPGIAGPADTIGPDSEI